MGFCPKCGKELADGEVCSCQAKKSSAINSAAVDNEVSGMVATAKELVLNPAQGVKNFVKNAGWLQVGVLAAIETILVIVFRMISMVRTNIRHYNDVKKWADQADMSVSKYLKWTGIDKYTYGFGDFFKQAFVSLLTTVAILALMAVIIYFAAKLIKKAQVTWTQSFAVAAVQAYVVVPCIIVNGLLGFLSGITFFSWIISTVNMFKNAAVGVMYYLAFKSFDDDSKTSVYATVLSFTAIQFVSLIVNFLFAKIF